jgi:predicted aldo/keto reductase-like oxidoreductase
MEALFDAKKAGKIRYIGFTGHKHPDIHMSMIELAAKNNFVFDAVQMPLSPLDASFRSFAKGVVPRLVKDGSGVLAMKVLAAGAIVRGNPPVATPVECFHYAMTLPISTLITGIDSEARLDQALDAVKKFKPMSQQEVAALIGKTREAALTGRLETFKTNINFDGTTRHPEWMG